MIITKQRLGGDFLINTTTVRYLGSVANI